MPIFHQRLTHVAELGFLARTLATQSGIRVSRALGRGIGTLLPVEIHPPIARIAAVRTLHWRLIFGPEALEAGGRFDQRAVHTEVLVAQQVQLGGLTDHLVKEFAADPMPQQTLAILTEG